MSTPQVQVPADAVKDLAPKGKLRAAINLGNPVLAQKDPATGEARGVSVDLARELARRLGVPAELVFFDSAGKVNEAAGKDVWDVGFFAVDPQRAQVVAFTAPYVVIEGAYMVATGSPIQANADVDRDGIKVVAGKGSAYDLYLARNLKAAKVVQVPTSADVIPTFVREKHDVAANIKSLLVQYAATHPEVRVLDGRFMAIEQAMGMGHGRPAGHRYLSAFIEEMKRDGFVARALEKSGQKDAQVAPSSTAAR